MTVVVAFAPLAAQNPEGSDPARGNPFGRDPVAVQRGDALFHERCAVCHGQKAQGAMAANLVQTRTVRRGTETRIFELIRDGIPGTDMPPQPDLNANQIWHVVSYLRNLALPGEQPPLAGDPVAGSEAFRRAGCSACHVVDGRGGFLGPALDSIAVQKASDRIRMDVLDPDAELAASFEPVVVTTRDGRRVEGVLKNEDTFVVLVLTSEGEVERFRRAELESVELPAGSPMPADYEETLSAEDLENLLAFLDRQRDPFTPVTRGFAVY